MSMLKARWYHHVWIFYRSYHDSFFLGQSGSLHHEDCIICFDVSMSVIAAVLSFVFAGSLAGIREGTVIAALLVGFIARLIGKKLAKPSKRHPLKNFDYHQIGRKDNIHNHFPHQRFLFPFP